MIQFFGYIYSQLLTVVYRHLEIIPNDSSHTISTQICFFVCIKFEFYHIWRSFLSFFFDFLSLGFLQFHFCTIIFFILCHSNHSSFIFLLNLFFKFIGVKILHVNVILNFWKLFLVQIFLLMSFPSFTGLYQTRFSRLLQMKMRKTIVEII